jgi:hypothetical protein
MQTPKDITRLHKVFFFQFCFSGMILFCTVRRRNPNSDRRQNKIAKTLVVATQDTYFTCVENTPSSVEAQEEYQ